MTDPSQPEWARWHSPREPFTVGVEEEVMLLDPGDWSLDQGFDQLRPLLTAELSSKLSAETHGAAVELESAPHARVGEAIAELAQLRSRLAGELAEHGRAAAGSGTHPFVTWEDTEVSPERRYQLVQETMRAVAEREPTFALHVHVAIPSPAEAVSAANRLRTHLPLLLALSASSPFWQGRDSGMASMRTPIFQAFPRVGMPRRFDSYRHYVETLDTLIRCGAFPEPTFVWWDLRLQPRYGTLEIRIMDTQIESWRTGALIALVQSLVRLEVCDGYAPQSLLDATELLAENRFIAARDGVRAELLDPDLGASVPLVDQLGPLLEACAPHARELGCERELGWVDDLVADPGDAVHRRLAGDHPEDLVALVAELSRRFASSAAVAGSGPSPLASARDLL